MSNELKVGDLAVVFKACIHCGDTFDLGQIIKVTGFKTAKGRSSCCKFLDFSTVAEYENSDFETGKYMWCLKRIPPLDELEGLKSQEDKPIEEKIF